MGVDDDALNVDHEGEGGCDDGLVREIAEIETEGSRDDV